MIQHLIDDLLRDIFCIDFLLQNWLLRNWHGDQSIEKSLASLLRNYGAN